MYNAEKVIDWHLILLKYQEKKKYFPCCGLFPVFSPKPAFHMEQNSTTYNAAPLCSVE